MSVRALSVVPGKPETAGVGDHPDPTPDEGSMLVQGLLVGVCGTDLEIVEQGYGWAPPGSDRLIIGHESLGQVIDAPAGSDFTTATWWPGSCVGPTRCPASRAASVSGISAATASTPSAASSSETAMRLEQWRVEPEFAIKLDPRARRRRRADGADLGGGEGLGAEREDRRPRAVHPPRGADHRRRPDRAARRAHRRPEGLRGARARQVGRGSEGRRWCTTSGGTFHAGDVSTLSASSRTSSSSARGTGPWCSS